jgi:hypothetical protein
MERSEEVEKILNKLRGQPEEIVRSSTARPIERSWSPRAVPGDRIDSGEFDRLRERVTERTKELPAVEHTHRPNTFRLVAITVAILLGAAVLIGALILAR